MFLKKKYLTFIALTFPAVGYLLLMFSAIGQVCFKPDPDNIEYKKKYLSLVNTMQAGKGLHYMSQNDFLQNSVDFRKLLNAADTHALSRGAHNSQHRRPEMSKIDRLRHEGGFRPALLFNCSSISRMKIRNKIGHGVSKQAFTAEFSGLQFAIKMVTRHIHEVRTCLDQIKQMKIAQQVFSQNKLSTPAYSVNHNDKTNQSNHKSSQHNTAFKPLQYHDANHEQNSKETHHTSTNPVINDSPAVEITQGERQRCYTYPTARLMKEILLSEQLQHRNLVSLLGYCLRSEESDSTDISEHGVISVYELGSRFVLDNLQILPWQTRLRHAIEMAELLDYLQHSPLGSLIVPDFKEGHLVMVNDSLKLIDLDDVNNLEPECDAMDNKDNPCPYNLRCVRALCEGFNAKENLKHMNKLVLKRLLFPLTFPESVVAKIGQLNADLDSLNLSARELRTQLVAIRTRLGQSSSRKS